MKNYNQEEEVQENTFFQNEWPLNTASFDRDDEKEDDEDEEQEESGDWGDVDPAGGEAPTAPGSAV